MDRDAKRLDLPFPVTKEERQAAFELHLERRSKKLSSPLFYKDDTPYFVDNKGDYYAFRGRDSKYNTNAKRRSDKLNLTPTKQDYFNQFGERIGQELFDKEQIDSLEQYKQRLPGEHVDHIVPVSRGGINHSRARRIIPGILNLIEGARDVSFAKRNALMIGSTPQEHIALQGPVPTPTMVNNIVSGALSLPSIFDIVNGDNNGFTKATKIAEQIAPPAVSMAASAFNQVNQYVADNNGGEDIFDAIPNGSAEERKAKNKKVNGDHVKNNGHTGNGFGDYISNTINGAARALNGQ